MEALPEHVIEEILVRLPVKSLLRFKCVCRSWRALIESRRFIHRHYNHESNQERLVFRRGEYSEGRFEERAYNPLWSNYSGKGKRHRIMGAVNGVLCEVSKSGDIVLFNPATHKVKRVPPLPFVCHCPRYKLRFGFGFGFDPSSGSGAYKIVVFESGAAESVWVYNSSSDCWKRVEGVGSRVIRTACWCWHDAFSNGVYYWVIECRNGGKHILAFDMRCEEFREIKIPDGVCAPGIAAYEDSIAVMPRQGEFELWVLGKQGGWSKSWLFKDTPKCWWPLCVWKDEVLFSNCRDYHLVAFNVTTQKDRIVETQDPNRYPIYKTPLCYKESLVSIKGDEVARMYDS